MKTRVPAERRPRKSDSPQRAPETEVDAPRQHAPPEHQALQRAADNETPDLAIVAALGAHAGNRAAVSAVQRATGPQVPVQRDDDEPEAPAATTETETQSAPAPDLEDEFDDHGAEVVEAMAEGEIEQGAIAAAFSWLSQTSTSLISTGLDLAQRGVDAIGYYSGEFRKWMLGRTIDMLAARGFDMSGVDEERMAEHLTKAGQFITGEIDELPVENVKLVKGGTTVEVGAGKLRGLHFRFSVVDLLSAGFSLDEVLLDPVVITKGEGRDSVRVGLRVRDVSVDIGTNIPQVLLGGLLQYIGGERVERDSGLDSGTVGGVAGGLGRMALAEALSAKEALSTAISTHASTAVGMKIGSVDATVVGSGTSHDVAGRATVSGSDLSVSAEQLGMLPGKKALSTFQVAGRFEARDVLARRLAGTPFIEGGAAKFEMGADGNGEVTATIMLHKSEVAKLAKDFVEVDPEHASRWKRMKAGAKKAAIGTAVKRFVKKDHKIDVRVPIVNGVIQLNAATFESSSGRLVEWAIRRFGIRGLAPIDVNALLKEKLDAKLTATATSTQSTPIHDANPETLATSTSEGSGD